MRTEISERTLLAGLSYRLRPTVSIELGAGAVLDGRLAEADLDPGPAFSLSVSWLALAEGARRPFVFLAGSFSMVTASASGARMTALDGRITALAGKTIANRLVLYAAARAFAGPVYFQDDVGSDVHHYTIGAGARLVLPGSIDLFVEGMPLGEQSVNAGAGLSF